MPKVHYVNTIRTFDKDGFKKRAGCLCFKSEAENEVCVTVCSVVRRVRGVLINLYNILHSRMA